MKPKPKVIYLFIDGLGLGAQDEETNPFTRYARSYLSVLGGVKSKSELPINWICVPTDAHLGVPGLPQSATGQTSLWTGINAPKIMGFHKTGFPGPTLIKIINEHSIIKIFKEHSLQATLLNAYSPLYLEYIKKKPRFKSVSSYLQLSSGQELLTIEKLKEKKAIYMDYTNEFFLKYFHTQGNEDKENLQIQDAFSQGLRLIEIAQDYDLVIHEFFLTDKAGHKKDWELAKWCIHTLEQVIDGIVKGMNPENELLLITSDHGNLEDLSTNTHTNNLVPTFAYGYKSHLVNKKIRSLMDIVPFIYEVVGIL